MASINVNIRKESDLKKQFESFCEDMGMSMTTAFNIFAKKAVREYRIPFEVGAEEPNRKTVSAINEVKKMKKNPAFGKTYTNVDTMLEDLLS